MVLSGWQCDNDTQKDMVRHTDIIIQLILYPHLWNDMQTLIFSTTVNRDWKLWIMDDLSVSVLTVWPEWVSNKQQLTAGGSEGCQMYGEGLGVPWWSGAELLRQSAGPGSSCRWFPPDGRSASCPGFCCPGRCLWCGRTRSASTVEKQCTGYGGRGRVSV